MLIAETQRLLLREITTDDAEQAYLLNLDPEVIRYTGDEPFASIEDAKAFLAQYDHYKTYGFGRWGVIEKASGEFLGWCGLKYTAELDEHDIGFRLFKKHWGKGFATESALTALELGFKKFNMTTIVGRAAVDNTASIHVLEKIGLQFVKRDFLHGDDTAIYHIHKKDFLKNRTENTDFLV